MSPSLPSEPKSLSPDLLVVAHMEAERGNPLASVWILFKGGVASCQVPAASFTSPCMSCNSWGAAPLP